MGGRLGQRTRFPRADIHDCSARVFRMSYLPCYHERTQLEKKTKQEISWSRRRLANWVFREPHATRCGLSSAGTSPWVFNWV